MRAFLLFLFVSLSLSLPVSAAAESKKDLVTTDDVYAAFDARDVNAMEALFADAYARYLKGESKPNDLRRLFGPFGTNNPAFIEFTQAWLKEYPDSIHANIAVAWIYNKTSWVIRGDGFAKQIYPDALRDFRHLQNKAWDLAQKAYEADKRFFVASDAILRTANGSGRQLEAFEVLDEAMEQNPDMGTLIRALDMTHPGWGGSWEMAEAMCDYYGPMIPWETRDPTLSCKVQAIGDFHFNIENRAWALEMSKTHDLPSMAYIRAKWALDTPEIREEAEFLRDFLNREGVTDMDLARDFDFYIAIDYDFEFVREAHARRARGFALEALKYDPYNPALIKVMQAGISRMSRDENGKVRITPVEDLSPDEEVDYARRLVFAQPYEPVHWLRYADRLVRRNDTETFLKDEPLHINAIVYSRQNVGSLAHYLAHKGRQLDFLQQLETGIVVPKWDQLSDAQKEAVRKKTEKLQRDWQPVLDRLDLDQEIRCPMVRAYRLLQSKCRSDNCGMEPRQQEMYETVMSDVKTRGVCRNEMLAPVDTLGYTPIPVDLTKPATFQ